MNMELLERLGSDFSLREVSAFPERSFDSSKRATEALESRDIELEERGVGNAMLRGAGVLAIGAIVGSGIYFGLQNPKRSTSVMRGVSYVSLIFIFLRPFRRAHLIEVHRR